MNAKDCKPGMRVRFRKWKDMEKEFGLNEDGDIDNFPYFCHEMSFMCGTNATIERVANLFSDKYVVVLFGFDGPDKICNTPVTSLNYVPWMLEPAEDETTAAEEAK